MFQGISLSETAHFFTNGLAIWHGLPDIRCIKVNNGRKSAILNLIELNFFRSFPHIKHHILFYSVNGLATCHGLPDIRYIKVNYG